MQAAFPIPELVTICLPSREFRIAKVGEVAVFVSGNREEIARLG